MSADPREPIAIVGIGCRLPGGANDPASLWALLRDGVDAITPIPPDRFDVDRLYDQHPATAGKIMSRWGGFIDGIDGFDAAFFEIAPREAERLDPQQRLLLETSWEALEDAGFPREGVAGSNAGVYIGMWINEYESRLFADTDRIDFHMTTGSGRYAASGRLSYFLDLLGPSVTIDTACSSSLVAIHLACQALESRECDLALAGGANVIVEPFITIAYSQSRMMAPDGHCKFGDADANGYVRSDGAVMIALKRLSSAQESGDHIYAIIRGSAVTNDGRSSGFLATPGQAGQEQMLRRAYAHAGVDPRTVQYVEAHGTGTPAGDPVELGALGAVVGACRDGEPCLVGSIKSNVGHTEGAAGAAGLVKLALALEHGEIPASLHVSQPNPAIPWDRLGVRINDRHRPWPVVDGPRRGGVSAFGIAGTNAHVVLEAAPPPLEPAARPSDRGAHVLAISASGTAALGALAERYTALLDASVTSPSELCAAAGTRRSHLQDRLAVVGSDAAELTEALRRRIGELNVEPRRSTAGQRVVFVFAGQGSQWLGMARQLLTSQPAFAAAMSDCDAAIRAEVGWSPIEVLIAGEQAPRLDDIDVVQPLLFAIQVSLAALWSSWGIAPVAVVGHSMGEVAAAYVAGALDLADASAVICRRSVLLRRISGRGAMALVDLPLAGAAAAIAGHEASVSIAVSNSPRSTVLSGDPIVLQSVLDTLQADDVFCRPVKVDVASHSPQVDPLLDELCEALTGISPHSARVPFRSTVSGTMLDGTMLGSDYWAANLRQPVMFADAVAELAAIAPTTFIELSPHPILVPSIEQVLHEADPDGAALASLRRGEPEQVTMLTALAALYESGATVDWAEVASPTASRVALPTYPWQRERHWYEAAPSRARRHGGHPLLGHAIRPATETGTVHWQTELDGDDLAFVRDHVVQGSAVLPATAFLELARAAVGVDPKESLIVRDLVLHATLAIDPAHPRELQVTVGGPSTSMHWRVHSRDATDGDNAEWQLHAEAAVVRIDRAAPYGATTDLAAVRSRCREHHDADAHLARMAARQLEYGGSFRSVAEVWVGSGEALGRIDGSDALAGSSEQRVARLDACLQVGLAALPNSTAGLTFVPVAADRVMLGAIDDATWSHARLVVVTPDAARCDITVTDAAGRTVAEWLGLEFRLLGSRDGRLAPLFFDVQWRPAALTAGDHHSDPCTWIVYAAGGAGEQVVERLRQAGERCIVVRPASVTTRTGDDEFGVDPLSSEGHAAVLSDALHTMSCSTVVVYAWGAAIGEDVADAETFGYLAPAALMQAIIARDPEVPPRVWLVTRGAHSDVPAQALLWGFGRVAASERPEVHCSLVDLGSRGDEADLYEELRAAPADQQVSYVDGERHVARLSSWPTPVRDNKRAVRTDSYRVVATAPGSLDSVGTLAQVRRDPIAGEVEIQVTAGALNFLDLLKALGIYPGMDTSAVVALGAECAGVVVAVGDGVDHVAPGDEVVTITPSYRDVGLLASFVTVPGAFVHRRPDNMSPPVASAAAVAFVTAYLALGELARVRAGETVLVHSATGGVGLAAIELCRHLGATVIATAGSDRKRDYLRSNGIEHAFDSRTTAFADDVRSITDGRGVDVVLNSLTGDAIAAGLSVLAPGGRFVEIGKRDVYAHAMLDLSSLKDNRSLFVVDLASLTEREPAFVTRIFRDVMAMLADGRLAALPTHTLPITEAVEAFRTMARAEHIGKLVLTVPADPIVAGSPAIRSDSTYLVTGGLGALGLAVAERLIQRGARHVVLVGRTAAGAAAQGAITALRSGGAKVMTIAADVSDAAELRSALSDVRAAMPPLRGVVHAAGVLADATIGTMNAERARAALAPKLHGAWNLHESTRDDPLDHFVLFSSVAAVLGLAGQSNYAAGNAFLDALADHRRASGRPARSIQWGPWSEIGLAASADDRGGRLAARGLGSLDPTEGLDAFDLLLDATDGNVVVARIDPSRWIDAEPGSAPLLSEVARTTETSRLTTDGSLAACLLATPAGFARRKAMQDALCAELAAVLRMQADRIDRHQPLKALGLDSLMALELRNRIESVTGLTVSATVAWNYPTLTLLAEHLATRMGIALDADVASPGPATTDAPVIEARPFDREPTASHDDLQAMLLAELAAVDRLLDGDGGSR